MLTQDLPVRDVMTTEVVTVAPDQSIEVAMGVLVSAGVDAAPVVDDAGTVVGMLSTGDLIVQDAQVHGPTVISLFGAYIELPSWRKEFEDDFKKAVGAVVSEVMDDEPITCGPDDTVGTAATLMHNNDASRLPVVDDGRLVGIIARGDILQAMVEGGRDASGSSDA
jgi:CBS domain-containing protein